MGLLGKAIACTKLSSAVTYGEADSIRAVIAGFHQVNGRSQGIVMSGTVSDFAGMLDGYGAECVDLPGGNCLILLPDGLDRELYAHRLSLSAGQTIHGQWLADDPSRAFERLSPYIG